MCLDRIEWKGLPSIKHLHSIECNLKGWNVLWLNHTHKHTQKPEIIVCNRILHLNSESSIFSSSKHKIDSFSIRWFFLLKCCATHSAAEKICTNQRKIKIQKNSTSAHIFFSTHPERFTICSFRSIFCAFSMQSKSGHRITIPSSFLFLHCPSRFFFFILYSKKKTVSLKTFRQAEFHGALFGIHSLSHEQYGNIKGNLIRLS